MVLRPSMQSFPQEPSLDCIRSVLPGQGWALGAAFSKCPGFESGPGLQRKREAVYKWEGLRQLSRTSNESFMRVSETKGQDLEEAVRLLYADDVPAGARTAPDTTSVSPGDLLFNSFPPFGM